MENKEKMYHINLSKKVFSFSFVTNSSSNSSLYTSLFIIENDFKLQSEKYILSISSLSNIDFFKLHNINCIFFILFCWNILFLRFVLSNMQLWKLEFEK